MQVVSSLVTSHKSRNASSKVQERGNRDSDKLLCNRCPLKHEARESGRGEMLYKTAGLEHHRREPAGGYN